MMVTRAAVVAEAREWLGTPFSHQHRAKQIGVDCAGLVIGVARELGIVPAGFDVNGYARTPDGSSLMAECTRFMRRITIAQMQPGDVCVLRFQQDPQHLGIVGDYLYGGLSLIHALGTTDGKGKVVEHRLMRTAAMQPICGFVLPGVE